MSKREKKVVVLMKLHGVSIYTTEMSKHMTESHVGDAVHMYTCELKCRADMKFTHSTAISLASLNCHPFGTAHRDNAETTHRYPRNQPLDTAINMESIKTQKTTRTVVILTKPEECSLWLFQHKDKAASYGVWEYCDPSVSAPPALSLKPERHMLPQGDLTANFLQTQRIRLSEWGWEYKEWH
jgi:hypothetical protein